MKLLAHCQFLLEQKKNYLLGTVSKIEYSKGFDKMKKLDSLPNEAT